MRSKSSPAVQDRLPPQPTPSFIEAARRKQIIACAIETIAELGYRRASLYEMARRAGVSKSVISYYFTSKDELISQVVAEVYAGARDFMLPQLEAVDHSAAAMLETFIRSNIAFIATHRNHVLALIEIAINARGEQPEGEETRIAELQQLLAFGQQSGEFRHFRTDVMAIALRTVIDAMAPGLAAATPQELNSYADELVELFDSATKKQG